MLDRRRFLGWTAAAFGALELAGELRAAGFAQTGVLDMEEANRRYFKGRADGFRLYGAGRMMTAGV